MSLPVVQRDGRLTCLREVEMERGSPGAPDGLGAELDAKSKHQTDGSVHSNQRVCHGGAGRQTGRSVEK